MKYFLSILFIFSLNLVSPLLAQDKNSADMSALLENKIWKVQLPKDKHYAMEMEFRSAGWKQTFLYDEKQTEICVSGISDYWRCDQIYSDDRCYTSAGKLWRKFCHVYHPDACNHSGTVYSEGR
mgnify:CR=1 FL=1